MGQQDSMAENNIGFETVTFPNCCIPFKRGIQPRIILDQEEEMSSKRHEAVHIEEKTGAVTDYVIGMEHCFSLNITFTNNI